MGLFREILYGVGKGIDDSQSSWVMIETYEEEEHKTDIIKFRAKKIHNRANAIYETIVEIKDDKDICIKNLRKEVKFLKSDIVDIRIKKTLIFSVFYTVLCSLVGIMSFFCSLIPLTLLCFTIPFYTALIKTINIKLKNGETVKVYYNMKNDPEILISRLR